MMLLLGDSVVFLLSFSLRLQACRKGRPGVSLQAIHLSLSRIKSSSALVYAYTLSQFKTRSPRRLATSSSGSIE